MSVDLDNYSRSHCFCEPIDLNKAVASYEFRYVGADSLPSRLCEFDAFAPSGISALVRTTVVGHDHLEGGENQ